MKRLPWVFAALLGAGCYYYEPLSVPAPQAGTYVGAQLTDSGSDNLWRYLGPDVRDVRGRLVTSDDTSYTLSVESVEQRHGTVLPWRGEKVVLPRVYVAGIGERHFATGRSVLVGTVAVGGMVLAIEAFQQMNQGSPTSGGGGGPSR